ncbi:MAG: hypothetical protein Q8M08_07635 [Bacteroidales bacterium]|nr:hypothetical protein [Bacteroidales bacterium]
MMKTKFRIISVFLILLIAVSISPQKISAQGGTISFQVFYDELSPYGNWVYDTDYGYVWIPDVAPGFVPYSTNGYWIFTNEGWTWVSDYSWGWAPFHYGRWYVDERYGPMWVPDREWGPGWVTWRRSGDFYGWAPIGPGVSLHIAYGDGYYVPNYQWTFVRDRDFGRTNINQYYINNSYNVTIINNSTVINNTRVDRSRNVTYNAGPQRDEVERRAGKKFIPVAIQESARPGQNLNKDRLQIYRPQVQRNTTTERQAAPAKVGRLENVKTSEQRKFETPSQKANQPARQQPSQHQRPAEQQKQKPPQQQQQQQRPAEQQKQKPQQQQRPAEPPKQQRPQNVDPPKKADKEKNSQKNRPPKTI